MAYKVHKTKTKNKSFFKKKLMQYPGHFQTGLEGKLPPLTVCPYPLLPVVHKFRKFRKIFFFNETVQVGEGIG